VLQHFRMFLCVTRPWPHLDLTYPGVTSGKFASWTKIKTVLVNISYKQRKFNVTDSEMEKKLGFPLRSLWIISGFGKVLPKKNYSTFCNRRQSAGGPGADPENCFGSDTLYLYRSRQSETQKGNRYGQEVYPSPLPSWLGGLGSTLRCPMGSGAEPQPLMIFGHYIHNFVRFHACFSAFWNLTGNLARPTKPNRSDHFCRPLVWRGQLPPVPPPSGSAHEMGKSALSSGFEEYDINRHDQHQSFRFCIHQTAVIDSVYLCEQILRLSNFFWSILFLWYFTAVYW